MREEFKVVQYERKSGPKYNLDFLILKVLKKYKVFMQAFRYIKRLR